MPESYLVVKRKRTIKEEGKGMVYEVTMEYKENRAGDPLYTKSTLKMEGGTRHFYDQLVDGSTVKLTWTPTQQSLEDFAGKEES